MLLNKLCILVTKTVENSISVFLYFHFIWNFFCEKNVFVMYLKFYKRCSFTKAIGLRTNTEHNTRGKQCCIFAIHILCTYVFGYVTFFISCPLLNVNRRPLCCIRVNVIIFAAFLCRTKLARFSAKKACLYLTLG